MSTRYCFALDLVADEDKIREYEEHHRRVWPEVEDSFRRAGIEVVELYRAGTRLFMLLDVNDDFSFARKSRIDAEDPVVVKWEALMSSYQHALPWSQPGEKWVLMERIYRFG